MPCIVHAEIPEVTLDSSAFPPDSWVAREASPARGGVACHVRLVARSACVAEAERGATLIVDGSENLLPSVLKLVRLLPAPMAALARATVFGAAAVRWRDASSCLTLGRVC